MLEAGVVQLALFGTYNDCRVSVVRRDYNGTLRGPLEVHPAERVHIKSL